MRKRIREAAAALIQATERPPTAWAIQAFALDSAFQFLDAEARRICEQGKRHARCSSVDTHRHNVSIALRAEGCRAALWEFCHLLVCLSVGVRHAWLRCQGDQQHGSAVLMTELHTLSVQACSSPSAKLKHQALPLLAAICNACRMCSGGL